jgi:hypothetical protein
LAAAAETAHANESSSAAAAEDRATGLIFDIRSTTQRRLEQSNDDDTPDHDDTDDEAEEGLSVEMQPSWTGRLRGYTRAAAATVDRSTDVFMEEVLRAQTAYVDVPDI